MSESAIKFPHHVVYDGVFAHRSAPIRLSVSHKDGLIKIYGLISEAVIVPEGTGVEIQVEAFDGHNRLRVIRTM